MKSLWRDKKLSAPARLLILLIRLYQYCLSPYLGNHCRFEPTCSNYFLEAIFESGFLLGSGKGFKRIFKCHPFHKGGYDPVSPTKRSLNQHSVKHDGVNTTANPSVKSKELS